jgi:hypothetical protein
MKLFQNYSPQTLRAAIEIELQKAGSTVVAAKIALKRLEEDPEYYTNMQKARMTKYIRKEADGKGGWRYFYKEQKAGNVKKNEIGKEGIPIKNLNKDINFKKNHASLNSELKKYSNYEVENLKKRLEKLKVMSESELYKISSEAINSIEGRINVIEKGEGEIVNYVKNLTPVHSLNSDKFMKVLNSGGLKALTAIENSGELKSHAYIESVIRPKYGDEAAKLAYNNKKTTKFDWEKALPEKSEEEAFEIWLNISKELNEYIKEEKEGAIGYSKDKEIGTDNHVFAIMGSNGNGSGYGEISIILNQDIMKHPDFNMTPSAGTSFLSGKQYEYRPWSAHNLERYETENGYEYNPNELEKIDKKKDFDKSKLNAKENPDYYDYMSKDIALQGDIEDYEKKELHGKWEAHLPSFVPIDKFAEILMTKETYDKLNLSDEQKKLNITILDKKSDILSYMEEGFRRGKWSKK